MKRIHRVVVFSFAIALMAGALMSATFDVITFFDEADMNPGDGSCMSQNIGLCTLRAAIQEANSLPGDDVINLYDAEFVLTIAGIDENSAATGDLDIQGNVTINGAGVGKTIIDAAGIDRVFDVLGGQLTLNDVTVTGGVATTVNSKLDGGIRVMGWPLSVYYCEITGNTANQGGAIYGSGTSSIVISNSSLTDNSTQDSGFTNFWGPAIRAEGGLTVLSSTVSGNGGPTATLYAIDSQCFSGSVDIENSTVSNNLVSGVGTWNCDVTITHATITGNASSGLVMGSFDGTNTQTVTNSMMAGNPVDCIFNSASVTFDHCLDSDGSCGLSAPAGDLPTTDPVLFPLHHWGGQTLMKYPSPTASPVIDAGNSSACSVRDQRGQVRGGDGNGDGLPGCDIGAVEATNLLLYDGFEDGTTDAWQ